MRTNTRLTKDKNFTMPQQPKQKNFEKLSAYLQLAAALAGGITLYFFAVPRAAFILFLHPLYLLAMGLSAIAKLVSESHKLLANWCEALSYFAAFAWCVNLLMQ